LSNLLRYNLLIILVVKSFVVSVVSNIRREGCRTARIAVFTYQSGFYHIPPGRLLHLLHLPFHQAILHPPPLRYR